MDATHKVSPMSSRIGLVQPPKASPTDWNLRPLQVRGSIRDQRAGNGSAGWKDSSRATSGEIVEG